MNVLEPEPSLRARSADLSWAWAVLLALLALTGWTYRTVSLDNERAALAQFDSRREEVADAIQARVGIYVEMMRGGIGLFQASDSVSRDEWAAYVAALDIQRKFPGIQGLGYAAWVPAAERGAYEAAMRAGGLPDFAIRPSGERETYVPVTYIEPPDRRNTSALGFDMHAQATRREAIARAVDTGEAIMTGKVRLVQEIDVDVQNGFLMYLPDYASGTAAPHSAPDNVEARRRQIRGFVYGAFRIGDLMTGVLGVNVPDVRLRIYDGESESDADLMYDDTQNATRPADGTEPPPAFAGTQTLTVGQHNWTLAVTSLPAFERRVASPTPTFILAAGIPVSLLIFGLLWSFATMRGRAEALAGRLSADARDRQARIAAVLETMIDGLITVDDEGRVESVNPAAERIFGRPSGRIVGQEVGLLIPELAAGSGIAGLAGQSREVAGRRADGSGFPMDLAVGEMEIGGRRMFTGVVRDITQRKADQRLKDEFIATASHELRTPVTSIKGAIGILRSRLVDQLPEAARELIDIAQRNSDRLVRLLNDILDMEKLDAGKMEFRMQPVDVPSLVHGALRENRGYAEEHKVTLALAGPLPQATVMGDEHRLMQVLNNLLSNAAKFSPSGGTVLLSAALAEGAVRLSVADQGPGIPPGFQAHIFEKFAQADASDARRKGGTGLGLGIAKAIVDRHGGRLSFDTAPDKGTTFHVDLPLAAA